MGKIRLMAILLLLSSPALAWWGGPKQDSQHAAVYLISGQEAVFDEGKIMWTVGRVQSMKIGGWTKVPAGQSLKLHPHLLLYNSVDIINWHIRWYRETYFEMFGFFEADKCYVAYFDFKAGHTNLSPLFDYSNFNNPSDVPYRLKRNKFNYEFSPIFESIDCEFKVKKIERNFDLRTK